MFLEGSKRPARIELDEGVTGVLLSPLTIATPREEAVFGQAIVSCLRALDAEARSTAPSVAVADGPAEPAAPVSDNLPAPTKDPTPGRVADGPALDRLTLA